MDEISNRNRRKWVERGVLFAIACFSLMIRLHYIHTTIVDHPIRGDVNQYYSYMWNLVNHQTFSMAVPGTANVSPDGFRDPGYPFFLALIAIFAGTGYPFYLTSLIAQCVLSAVTTWTFVVLARRWIGFPYAVGVGVLMSLWPHGITLAGTLLSETVLGVMVALSLLAFDTAGRRESVTLASLAGLAFGAASLINAVLSPFAPIAGVYMAWKCREQRTFWIALALFATLPVAAWGVRTASLSAEHTSGERASMNFVQGSWPEYHPAYLPYLAGQPWASRQMDAIGAEAALFQNDRIAGFKSIFSRFEKDWWRYTTWYLSKPFELWGWSIGIGQEDISVFPTRESPLSSGSWLTSTTNICFFLSPFVMLFASAGAVLSLIPRYSMPKGLRLAAYLAIFTTIIYTLLQADARYVTPFRGIQLCLAAFAVTALVRFLRAIRSKKNSQCFEFPN